MAVDKLLSDQSHGAFGTGLHQRLDCVLNSCCLLTFKRCGMTLLQMIGSIHFITLIWHTRVSLPFTFVLNHCQHQAVKDPRQPEVVYYLPTEWKRPADRIKTTRWQTRCNTHVCCQPDANRIEKHSLHLYHHITVFSEGSWINVGIQIMSMEGKISWVETSCQNIHACQHFS